MPDIQVNFEWAKSSAITETGVHELVNMGWAMTGGPFLGDTPVETVAFFLAMEMTPNKLYGQDAPVQMAWALSMTPQLVTHVTEVVQMGWAIEMQNQAINTPTFPPSTPIAPAVSSGVIPQHGSGTGIYPKWVRREIKEVRVHRHVDAHETGGQDETGFRFAWDLAINIRKSSLATHWNFIKARFGAGQAFYFYDLENNGYYYDPTGVNTTGRHLVRFDQEVVPQIYEFGERFVIEYTLLEVA